MNTIETIFRRLWVSSVVVLLFVALIWGGCSLRRWHAQKQTDQIKQIAKGLANARGPEADQLFEKLEPYWKNKDPLIRRTVPLHLGWLSAKANPQVTKQTVTILLELLKDPDNRVSIAAMHGLKWLGPRAAVIIPELEEIIRTEKGSMHTLESLEILGAMGSEARGAVPVISEALNNEMSLKETRYFVRSSAANALGRIGKDAAPALPALRAARSGGDAESREAVARAIAAIEEGQQKESNER